MGGWGADLSGRRLTRDWTVFGVKVAKGLWVPDGQVNFGFVVGTIGGCWGRQVGTGEEMGIQLFLPVINLKIFNPGFFGQRVKGKSKFVIFADPGDKRLREEVELSGKRRVFGKSLDFIGGWSCGNLG